MKQRSWLALASVICICGCHDESGDVSQCIPGCDLLSEKCVDGTCMSLCAEPCGDGMHCELGECVPLDCEPECGDDSTCVNGHCVPNEEDPNVCKGLMCKDNMTRCDTETGQWATCPLGTGCHLGHCLEGLGAECEEGTCSEDGSKACLSGKWATCGSLETCVNGSCELLDGDCSPGRCSEDGAYICNEDGVFEACEVGMACKEGKCNIDYDEETAMLWKLCERNSDCPSGMCLFELTPSRAFSSIAYSLVNADTIPVSVLDDRIPDGTGICSVDCTKDANICDLHNNGNVQYSCQLILLGDSPYPPENEYGEKLNLPFHQASSFKISDMEVAPYASVCRPNDAYGMMYSKTFCASCMSSEDCSADEVCAGGFCASKCSTDNMCPLGFSCINLSGDAEVKNQVCMPDSGTCGSCLDLDGDGQGFGHCPVPGYDCDPINPDIYYTTELPKVCTHDVTDTNCNGKIDTFELLNSPEHCRFCDDACKGTTELTIGNIARTCELRAEKTLDDYEFSSFNPSDETTYLTQCRDTCPDGYGDCNGDHRDGCEVNLKETGVIYSWDNDKDGYGIIDENASVYCCGYDTTNCYAYQGTRYGSAIEVGWDRAAGDAWDNVQEGVENLSNDISDCDDTSYETRPNTADVCDGFKNSCTVSVDENGNYKDGENDIFIDRLGKESELGNDCFVYPAGNGTTACAQGKVQCQVGSDGKYSMTCVSDHAQIESGTQVCDGLDNNCDGQIDESYIPSFTDAQDSINSDGSINICKFKITNCANGEEYKTNGGYQMFHARDYDFYGDGIDSNCDGYDYDLNKAIFVAKAGSGNMDGNDAHSGGPNSPVKTLDTAIELACQNASSIYYCQDIIVDSAVTSSWAHDGTITVPTYSQVNNIYSGYTRLAQISDLGTKACASAGCMNKVLLPTETVPHEAVRIYGGFSTSISGSNKNWIKPDSTTSQYSYTYNPDNKSNRMFALVKGDGRYPLSVKFDRVSLKLNSIAFKGSNESGQIKNEALQNGLMLVGLTCGTKGCRHLTLNDSPITVTGGTGRDNSEIQHRSNVWDSIYMNGFNGRHFYRDWTDWSGNKSNFITNRSNNAMFSNYYSSKDVWSSVPYSVYNSLRCPDGSSPRGGGPGSYCCKDDCHDINFKSSRYGNGGTGSGYGGSSVNLGVTTGYGCDESYHFSGKDHADNYEQYKYSDGTPVMGGNGGHGDGGAGGSNSGVHCTKVITTSHGGFYVDCTTSAADGKPGQSGGGGGGGTAYHCYTMYNKTDAWVHAGSGGAGGCGGYGGKSGGMGVSATGLILNSPSNTSDKFSFHLNNSKINTAAINATAGAGGAAQAGQAGVAGGWRGDGYGYAREGITKDWHCHKATAGGVGGTGGGGGAGAKGKSGEAFGVVFLDKNKIDVNTNKTTLENYGYQYTLSLQMLLQAPGKYISVNTQENGADGGKGSKTSMQPSKVRAAEPDMSASGGLPNSGTVKDSKGHSMVLQFITDSSF